MKLSKHCLIALIIAVVTGSHSYAQEQGGKKNAPATEEQVVVFVCEHGSAKSVVAAAHFNRLAKERKLNLRAISRGTNPDDEIAPKAAEGLRGDGLSVGTEKPKKLSVEDLTNAVRVIAFCQLPDAYGRAVQVDQWNDVPPISEDYGKARNVILERTLRLLIELKSSSNDRLHELERKLREAAGHLAQLTAIVESLRSEIADLKGQNSEPLIAHSSQAKQEDKSNEAFKERIVEPGLGGDERGHAIEPKPEIFIQTRYSAAPIRNSGSEFEPNISLTRIETRWSGKVSNRFGAGLEVQYHPALDGSPEELVNDAFIEYYLGNHATIRAGQFIKPFGFDIQQSSAVRESPERAIFAGYFFPGQRDRGVMLSGDFGFLKSTAFHQVHYFVGAFNGNRFFADVNRQMNYILRVRKVFDRPSLGIGVSLQRGKQPLPPGIVGDNDENLAGIDLQLALGRFGLRTEFVAGNMPSTLLGLEPEFAPAFRPGGHSAGGHVFLTYRVSNNDNIYVRYDQFNGDPVSGAKVRAFNFGYFRRLNEFSRVSFDYQFKNRPSFNDDAVNGRLNLSWAIEF